jgi:hypothetical protein
MKSAFKLALAFAVIALAISFNALGQTKGGALSKQIAGAWTVVSNDTIAPNGSKRQDYGPNPKGILILDAGGRYAYVLGRPDRQKFKPSANLRLDTPAAEFGEAARAFAANSGTWSVNEADKTLIRKYEIALIPNNDKQETKASVGLSKGELKLLITSADGTKNETVYRRAK